MSTIYVIVKPYKAWNNAFETLGNEKKPINGDKYMGIVPSDSGLNVVTWQRQGAVLLVDINNAPVNALSASVRSGLLKSIKTAQEDPEVKIIVITGAGDYFIAGADIKEFGQAPKQPLLKDVCAQIELSEKPVVAAIHGAALGGGLEVALAAHYRIALSNTQFALPEVTLGLIPGAGGTQRAPRLIGVKPALDLMLSGKPINAQKAKELGLIDQLSTDTDIIKAGLAYANELVGISALPKRTCDRQIPDSSPEQSKAAIAQARDELNNKYRGLFSPACIIDAVEFALSNGFAAGQDKERSLFEKCLETDQRKALVYAFFAQRQATKVPSTNKAKPRTIKTIGIVGGGTMGAGIAVAILDAGLPVVMVERDVPSLERGRANVIKVYDSLIKRGRLSITDYERRMTLFTGATNYEALAQVDLVIEAVFEDLEVKLAVFKELDKTCKAGAILASNTSYLDINKLADSVARPQDVIGLHFFSPANIMKLLEIVVSDSVADDVVATGFALAKKLKKVAVRAGVCDGFIGNRVLAAYRQTADYLLADGASPYEIDLAMKSFGFPMGPFQVSDLAGGDIGWATRKRRAGTRDPQLRYVAIADRLCEQGRFGQKTGKGWYTYPEGNRNGLEDPEVLAIVAAERQAMGITTRTFSQPEIIRRYMTAMINESANVVSEGIALRPLDVDVVMLNGYGFPRHKGGPLHYADSVGLKNVLADINEFAKEDPFFWKPSPLLLNLVQQNKCFADLNTNT